MNRLLIISVLDYRKQPNNREHHLVKYFSERFKEVTLVYKRKNLHGSFWNMTKDLLFPTSRSYEQNGIKFVEINPLLNHYPGLSRDVAGYNPTTTTRKGSLRRFLLMGVSAFGIVKDLCFLPSMLFFAFTKTEGKFDVCIALGPWGNLIGLWMKKLKRVKCLVYEDRDYEPAFLVPRFRQRYTEGLEKYLMRKADLIVSIGKGLANLRERQVERRVYVIPTGVDYKMFEKAQEKPPHPPTLVYTGNLTFWSGLDVIISALPEIIKHINQIRLLIVGGGIVSYQNMLNRIVKEHGLEKQVTFLGAKGHHELPYILRDADIGLALFQPTMFRKYAVPLKVFEYMASGLPAIGVKGTETEEILRDYGCGLAVEYTKEALSAAVVTLFKDKETYSRLSNNAKKYSREFEWEGLLNKEYDLIQRTYRQCQGAG